MYRGNIAQVPCESLTVKPLHFFYSMYDLGLVCGFTRTYKFSIVVSTLEVMAVWYHEQLTVTVEAEIHRRIWCRMVEGRNVTIHPETRKNSHTKLMTTGSVKGRWLGRRGPHKWPERSPDLDTL
ncbi:hypothetical protein C0J52_06538 [Blattella germanica]|nr:hypothetical protein C0J52_06538 [Blattella germanica]